MDCALWLNRRKVYSADEIAEAPDIPALRGYFLAGSLVGWLNDHGGERYAKKLAKLRRDDPELNGRLAEIFGGSPEDGRRFEGGGQTSPSENMPEGTAGSFIRSAGSYGSFSEKHIASFRFGNTSGSYAPGSGIHEWEWEWLLRTYGSFTSFGFGSFGAFGRARHFNIINLGSFGSFSFGSFWSMGNFGSFPVPEAVDPDCLDEYDRIMLETLLLCPLDRFGYGIHNI